MLSSFVIKTNIKVNATVANIFNKIAHIDIDDIDYSVGVKPYFDSMSMNLQGEKYLDRFLEDKAQYNGMANFWVQNWRFDDECVLYDECEKFHGAISTLEYFIKTFFMPLNVSLNGTIVGVNTDIPMAYVYNVKDNVIELDEPLTRVFNRFYDKKQQEEEDFDYNTPEYKNFREVYSYIDELFEVAIGKVQWIEFEHIHNIHMDNFGKVDWEEWKKEYEILV